MASVTAALLRARWQNAARQLNHLTGLQLYFTFIYVLATVDVLSLVFVFFLHTSYYRFRLLAALMSIIYIFTSIFFT